MDTGSTPDHIKLTCACGARVVVPALAAGRKVRCPHCQQALLVPGGQAPARTTAAPTVAEPQGAPSGADTITIACRCGASFTVPRSAAGRRGRCRRCGATVEITATGAADPTGRSRRGEPAVVAKSVPPASEQVGVTDDDLEPLRLVVEPPVAPLPRAGPIKPAGPPVICPSCAQELPAGAKVCVACGVYVKNGRPILMRDDRRVDQAYTVTEGILRWLSWIVWVGMYPIASEAFGLRKPWAVRGTALLTVLVSVWFFAVVIYTSEPTDSGHLGLMLWCGNTSASSTLSAANEAGDEFSDETGDESAEESGDDEVPWTEAELDAVAQFRPYQLFTHALLHGDILHLVGNMLFLMVLGTRVNALIGNILTIALYPLLAILAGLAQLTAFSDGPMAPVLGASGAVMGLAGMYLILFPAHKVHMAIWLRWGLIAGFKLSLKMFAVRGIWVVLFYIAFDVLYTVLGAEDDVAHWAHLGGFAAGVGLALILLVGRLVDARGGDLFSVVLGRYAWWLLGKPSARRVSLW